MNRFALNFICKNESHVILRMLESVRPFTDLIVAVDTGSTDDTMVLIRGFGEKYRIPTYVFERPFDDFGRSRNFALEKLRATADELKWDLAKTWGFRMDCDEVAELSGRFEKENVQEDLGTAPLHFKGYADDTKTYRDLFFRLSKDFSWDGPIHEELECSTDTVTNFTVKGITIIREAVGATWKGDQEQKSLRYQAMVRDHIERGNRTFKWLFHMGSTYIDAANFCKDKNREKEHLTEARRWFEEIGKLKIESRHDRYKWLLWLGNVRERLGEEESEVRETYLKAYSVDARHGEPLGAVILRCIRLRKWNVAYLYTSFAVANFQGNQPAGLDIELVEEAIYEWQLLLYHCTVCVYSGRLTEGGTAMRQLRTVLKEKQLTLPDQLLIKGSLLRLRIAAGFRRLRGTSLFTL